MSENQVATVARQDVQFFNQDQVSLLKRTIAKDATDDELSLFVNQCKRTGLDPFTRQIYFIKDKQGKVTVCSSIDGLRLVAERSDKYEGQTKPEWCGTDGVWKDIWLDTAPPAASRVGVWKHGFREPTYGVAVFNEYAGRYAFDDNYGKFKKGDLTFMWNKMPALMIAKVAEALALRKAFPNDLSGIYSSEEAELIEAQSTPAAAPAQPKQVKNVIKDAKDPFIFSGGKFQGKKFADVMPEDFDAELAKYEAVNPKSPNLQKLIDNMKEFKKPAANAMSELDEKLGLKKEEAAQ